MHDSEIGRNVRRERTKTLFKLVFNEDPDEFIWENNKKFQSTSNTDYFVITSRQSGKVLDASLSHQDEVILWDRHGRDNQLWFWAGHTIRNKQYPSRVLDFQSENWKKSGWGRVQLHPYNGGPNQKWSFTDLNGQIVSIIPRSAF